MAAIILFLLISAGGGQVLQWYLPQPLVTMDTTVADVSGETGRKSYSQPPLLRGEGVPSGRLLPYKDTLPYSQDGTEREV